MAGQVSLRGRRRKPAPGAVDAVLVIATLVGGPFAGRAAVAAEPPPAPPVAAPAPAVIQVEADAQAAQRIRQIDQMLQPAVRTELEFIRQACGELSSAVRLNIREAAQQAVAEVAREWVGRQARPARGTFVPRELLHRRIAAAVEAAVPPEAFAAYRRESAAREARRQEAARFRIVAKVDEHLDLTDAQREAILADLRRDWQASWIRELFDNGGVVVNGQRPAPDYAAACITPHLDAKQQEAWGAWARAVSGMQLTIHMGQGVSLEVQGLQQDDAWWKR